MHYDLTPDAARRVPRAGSSPSSACRSSAAAAAPRPSTSRPLVDAVPRPRRRRRRELEHEAGATSIYTLHAVRAGRHRTSSIGERTNANGSKKFREAMLDGDWDTVRRRWPREQEKEGAHVLDVCVDYVGRDGTADMDEIASPLRHPGHRAADDRLHRAAGHRDRRSSGSAAGPSSTRSTSRTATRPGTRLDRFLPLAARVRRRRRRARCIDEEGQARTPSGSCGSPRRIHDLAVDRYGLEPERPVLRPARPHARHRHRGEPRRRHGHDRGHPAHQGGAARRPHDARPVEHLASASTRRPATSSTRCSCTSAPQAGLDAAIVHAARIMPLDRIPEEQVRGLPRPHLRPARADGYDPLQELLDDVRGRDGGRRSRRRTAPAGRSSSGC